MMAGTLKMKNDNRDRGIMSPEKTVVQKLTAKQEGNPDPIERQGNPGF
jgi:hypothetical protein